MREECFSLRRQLEELKKAKEKKEQELGDRDKAIAQVTVGSIHSMTSLAPQDPALSVRQGQGHCAGTSGLWGATEITLAEKVKAL